jgi:hypothetical protein
VVTELETGAGPLAKQRDLGRIDGAVAMDLPLVDEADRRHTMRSQRTNELTSEAIMVRG